MTTYFPCFFGKCFGLIHSSNNKKKQTKKQMFHSCVLHCFVRVVAFFYSKFISNENHIVVLHIKTNTYAVTMRLFFPDSY